MSQRTTEDVWHEVSDSWAKHREKLFALTRRASEWMIEAIDPRPGQVVLELGAGPGETGFLAADRLGPDGKLISSDIAPGMLDASRAGAEARGLRNVEHRIIDAQRLGLGDASVDAILSRFAFMLLDDPAAAARECNRVLRPRGRLAYAVWGPPDKNLWIVFIGLAAMQHGLLEPADPYGPGGLFSLSARERNEEMLREAGFQHVRVEELDLPFRFPSFDAYWSLQSEVAGSVALALRSASPEQVRAVRETVEELAQQARADDGSYTFDCRIVCCAAE